MIFCATHALLASNRSCRLEKHDSADTNSGNSRSGTSEKTLKGGFGTFPIEVPRNCNSEFEQKILPRGKTRLGSFNEKILSLYARVLTTREIQQPIQEIYKVEVSPTLLSNVTEVVMEDVANSGKNVKD